MTAAAVGNDEAHADVIIIGSGISALTCAALLSKQGRKVLLLEQYKKPGGYLHGFERFGHHFDTGAHYVGAMQPGQPFQVLLEYLGVYSPELFVPLEQSGFDVLHFPERRVTFPQGYPALIDALCSQFPAERSAIERYFTLVREIVHEFPTYQFSDEMALELPPLALDRSLAEVVESLTQDRQLRSVFYAYCVLHAVRPEHVPFGFHAIVTDSLVRGPCGFSHGGSALAERFIERIEAAGGRVLLKHRVTRLHVKDGQVRAVELENGQRFSAEWVVSSIHPKATLGLIDDPAVFRPAWRERVRGLRESVGLFGVYANCSEAMPLQPRQNHYFFSSSDPDAMLESPGPDQLPGAMFGCVPNRVGADARGRVPLVLHAASPIEWFEPWREQRFGRRGPGYKQFKAGYAEQMFQLVERYYPGFGATRGGYVTSSPLTNLHFNGSVDGSAYGIYHSLQTTGPRALGPRTKVRNLLLTGQNYVFPGLFGAAVSALRTSGHMIGIKAVLRDLEQRVSPA